MTATRKALVVGVDGVRYDTLLAARTPRLDKLAAGGFRTPAPLYPRQPEPTVSGPGWSSVASGTWPNRHRVRDNTLAGNDLARHPDFLTRATRTGQRTFAGLGWAGHRAAGVRRGRERVRSSRPAGTVRSAATAHRT